MLSRREFIKRERKYSTDKSKRLVFMIKAQLFLLCFCIGFAFINLAVELITTQYSSIVNAAYFQDKQCRNAYVGAGTQAVYSEIWESSSAVARYKRFRSLLDSEQNYFCFYTRFDDNLISTDTDISELCGKAPSPVSMPSRIPEGYDIDTCYNDPEVLALCTSELKYYFIESVCLSPEYFDVFTVRLADGEVYTLEDTVMKSLDDVMPIIMGYNYMGVFKLGDTVTLMPVFGGELNVTYRIVGFLAKDALFYTSNDGLVTMDNSFVFSMPKPEFMPADELEDNFVKKCASIYEQTVIVTDTEADINEVQLSINSIADKANVPRLYIDGGYKYAPSFINGLNSYEYNNMMFVILLVLIVFACVSVSASLVTKINLNRRDYAVHIIAGGTLKDIKRYVRAEAVYFLKYFYLLLCIASPVIFFPVILVDLARGLLLSAEFLVGAAAVLVLMYGIICVPIEISFGKLSVSELLRRSE